MFDLEHTTLPECRKGINVTFDDGRTVFYRFPSGVLPNNVSKEYENGYITYFLEHLQRTTTNSKNELILTRAPNSIQLY